MAPRAWYGRALAAFAASGALAASLAMWGFTVDDALIPLRYARNLAAGAGYRFDAGGPSTDGVTPLPWAPLLVPLSSTDLLVGLVRVKALGVALWTVAAAALGYRLGEEATSPRALGVRAFGLAIVALAFPVGAWAASGMETALALALATAAAVAFPRPRLTASFAGVLATVRPELVVWGLALTAGALVSSISSRSPRPGAAPSARAARRLAASALALALGPFLAVALVRLAVFGRPAPLAILAKPSDLEHGLRYAVAATIYVLSPVLACGPLALRRTTSARARSLAIAAAAHVLVVVAVGGDWMPYARLVVPIAPGLVLVFADLARDAKTWAAQGALLLRGGAAVVLGVALAVTGAPRGRHVHADRADLVARARPLLAGRKVVAALDIGWVGAATDARIVDLAGLTDPTIAALPGGHTSKGVDLAMLLERDVDTIVVYSAPRLVERRITEPPLFAERFAAVATLPLGNEGASYTIFGRR